MHSIGLTQPKVRWQGNLGVNPTDHREGWRMDWSVGRGREKQIDNNQPSYLEYLYGLAYYFY